MARRHIMSAACVALALAMPAAGTAQELTAEQILALLEAQRAALAGGDDLGSSRTLEFVTESTPATDAGISLGTEVAGDALAVAGGDLTVTMPEELVLDLTIFFEYDSALLKAESKSQVQALCDAITASGTEGSYQIIGHTDAAGSVQYNLSLSQARAEEVVRYMVSECGISADQLVAVGMGEARLKDAADPRSDSNRRVEIQVAL